MQNPIISAGLVYAYINGYEEDGFLNMQITDSYHHIDDGFYRQVMENARSADEDDNMVHIFVVIGAKEKVGCVYKVIEDELKKNVQRILGRRNIHKSSNKLDDTGNEFCKCVQEFFFEQSSHYPKRLFVDCESFVFAGIYCSRLPEDMADSIADDIFSMWMERESPCLYGKQLMFRSFFINDFLGRKVIASIPHSQTGQWNLIFEGGMQLPLEREFPYSKETINPRELGAFCTSSIQTILMNPVYSYGILLEPSDICQEWHKVFIYLCASSDYVWDKYNFAEVYEKFLKFLKDNICEVMEAEPIISKETYHDVLLKHIESFRNFMKGEDETVISKDLHQTLNSRYVYLPYIWSLLPHKETYGGFSSSVLHNMVNKAITSENKHEKGILWEDAASYMLDNISGWKITGRRIRAGAQEIDVSIANVSLDDELWKLGAYILVECKNWLKRVELHQIRNIAYISGMKGNKTAILFTANGITKNAEKEIVRLVAENLSIICITAEDLLNIKDSSDCRNLILNKWQELQDKVDISSIM